MSGQHHEKRSGPRSYADRFKKFFSLTLHHAKLHTGVGVVCAVAYFDPGNWGVDLQAGSEYGYRLLFVVLLAGIFAAFLQVLASRLGCVTGLDLASHCRLLLYNRPKHRLLYRWLGLYPLYALSEVAIIATDLAELLGSAIALCLLFPKLQLWHGVLITAFDVILILAMRDPLRGKPVRMFEILIAVMVLVVLVSMLIIISKVEVDWSDAFRGYLPSKYIFAKGGVYTSVGIIGATVMPHSLFLGSALATQDRIQFRKRHSEKINQSDVSQDCEDAIVETRSTKSQSFFPRILKSCKESVLSVFRSPPPSLYASSATRHNEHINNSYEFVRAHIYHGTFDMVGSLLGFAVVINSLILILASSVFFYNNPTTGQQPASLFDAYDLIRDLVGLPAAKIFAVALLSAGQSSSIIATVAGQAVCEGFLKWRVSAVVRRLMTRLLAIIPSMVVAIAVGRSGVDTLLVASQVVLSVVLPFIVFPLLWCTSSRAIMSVKKGVDCAPDKGLNSMPSTSRGQELTPLPKNEGDGIESGGNPQEGVISYSNNKITTVIGGVIWFVIVAANLYALVELGTSSGSI